MERKKIPINRIGKWFDENDFKLEVELARESIESDQSIVLILYKVDKENSLVDDLYNESYNNNIRFLPPKEIYVLPVFEEPENKTYNKNGSLRYLQDGKMNFLIYEDQLKELETDIEYGDYIGYPIDEKTVKMFTVVNDGKKFYNNKNTIMGYKGVIRKIECVPTDNYEFKAI